MGNSFADMLQDLGFLEDLGDAEGSSSSQLQHFPALSVGGAAASSAGISGQPGPVLDGQGDMTVSGTIRALQFLPLSDESANCNICQTDLDALGILQQLKI